jgi:hypothetical protein
MDASDVLLAQWGEQVKQIWKGMHQYRQESLAIAIVGIVLAGVAVMQQVAEVLHERLSEPCKVSSYERRLQRLIANEDVPVTECWERFLQHTLPFWDKRRATLVLDCTPYNDRFTIVFVGILVQKRLLPLAWELMPQAEEWDEGQWQIVERLFAQVAQFLLAREVILLADRGLAALPLIRLCEQRHWHYVLRIQNDEYCRRSFRSSYRDWQRGCDFLPKAGTSWYGRILLWKSHGFACSLAACWEPDDKEAWFLISDLPASPRLVSLYGLRMRVEATFQDTKRRRWCIERSQLRDERHLNRWLLIIFLAFWWTTHLGASCKHHGHAKEFDRSDRYEKSLLRLGHLWIRELLKRANRGMRQQASLEVARLTNCLPFHHTKEGLRFSIHFY